MSINRSELPLCKDCRWGVFKASGLGSTENRKCSHPNIIWRELVEGRVSYPFCADVRDNDERCGIEGKSWEAKE